MAAASRFNQWQCVFAMISKNTLSLNEEGIGMRESFNFLTV